MRWRRQLLLVGAVLRTTKLVALAATSVISVTFLIAPLVFGLRNTLRDLDVGVIFHLSLIVSLAGAGLVMDDPAHETLSVAPVSRARVAVIRMLAGMCLLVPVWATQLWLVPQLIDTDADIPVMGLAIEGPILVVWIWAIALLSLKRFDGHASSIAVPVALIGSAVMFFLPEQIALFENPASQGFKESRIRFCVLGALGLVTLVHALRLRSSKVWRR